MSDAIKSIYVIINPAAGQDRPILGAMNRAFQTAEIEWDVRLTKKAGDAQQFAQEAIAAGVDAVAVYGGDGTVMEVAGALAGTNVPLAIFPGGTANVMSVELGIPGDLTEAVALVCGQAREIRILDMGRVRGQLFMLRLGIGFFAETTKGTEREAKNRMGALAYTLSALQALPKTQMSRYYLMLDGEEVEVEGVACFIANSGNLGIPGLSLSKAISVNDGLLDVIVLPSLNVGTALNVAANAVGLTDSLPHWQAREIRLVADPPQSIECDGEMIDPTPVSASVVPQALRVIVPNPATVGDVKDEVKKATS